MNIQEQVSLSDYSTMRLGGPAKYFVEVHSEDEVAEASKWAKEKNQKIVMIGDGSNIVWRDSGFDGLVILNRLKGFNISTENDPVTMTAAAGEDWDSIVERTVEAGYSGVEFLSWIPGRVGAVPVQNVGAYGREVSEVLESVRAFDTQTEQFVEISNQDCQFSYRDSRFKTADRGRFLIVSIRIRLSREAAHPPFYESLQMYLDDNNITEYSPAHIRQAVIAVRSKKLPDPDEVANNGSFFANPIINKSKAEELLQQYPKLANWPADQDNVKVSAAWLIEQAGFKDYHDQTTGMATWDKQPLVLINEHAKSTNDVLAFKQKIIEAVQGKFGITLEQEPELI